MAAPIASPSELALFLELDPAEINTERATFLLAQAQAKCERYIKPTVLPVDAKDVVLTVAGRAYTNVTSAHQMGIGSANISYGAQNSSTGIGGLFLSRSDKADLRRVAGRTGAFSVSMLDPTRYPPSTP